MPTNRKLTELFRAIATDDIGVAASIASQICEYEERKGHRSAARALRGALLKNGIAKKSTQDFPEAVQQNGTGFLATGLVNLPADASLFEIVLSPSARSVLDAVVAEWKNRDLLRERGLLPRSKLFFHGPPGCGKSLTARALGHDLHLPVYLVRFDSVIGAYLGQTAIHLRQLFHFAEITPCILLLDELDALGKRRGNPLDVGELDRIVIALMQELEHSKPQGLIIGTSNLAKNLDDALWRRFDLTVLFKSPLKSALTAFCRRLAAKFGIRLSRRVLGRCVAVDSFAEAEAIVIAEARRQALAGK